MDDRSLNHMRSVLSSKSMRLSDEDKAKQRKKCFKFYFLELLDKHEILSDEIIKKINELFSYYISINDEKRLSDLYFDSKIFYCNTTVQAYYVETIIDIIEKRIDEDQLTAHKFIELFKGYHLDLYNQITVLDQSYNAYLNEDDYETKQKLGKKHYDSQEVFVQKIEKASPTDVLFISFVIHYLQVDLFPFDKYFYAKNLYYNDSEKYIYWEENKHNLWYYYNKVLSEKTDWTDDLFNSTVFDKFFHNNFNNILETLHLNFNTLIYSINENVSTACMLANIIGEVPNVAISSYTKDELENVIKVYYLMKVYTVYEDKEKISKLDILRYFPEIDYVRDCNDILQVVACQIELKNVKEIIAYLFANIGLNSSAQNEAIKTKNNQYKEEYDALYNKYVSAKSIADRLNDLLTKVKDNSETVHIANNYEKKLAEKEDEILHLKEKIAIQNEYISMIENIDYNPIDESSTDVEEKISGLLMHKYLFVGRETDLLREIKKDFPNSLYMTDNKFLLQGQMKYDGIIYLVKDMDHSMFYKVQSYDRTTARVSFNDKNKERLYSLMIETFM